MNIKNHFLVAMPSMLDDNFRFSVVYMCEHNEDGAMGLIVNRPIDLSIGDMLEQIDIEPALGISHPHSLANPVLFGGPVAEDRGFVLHQNQRHYGSSVNLANNLTVTTSKDILTMLGTSQEPEHYVVTLGYAGWTAGQLERELSENSWLVIEADPTVIFDTPIEQRWHKALAHLGIDPLHLSMEIGHA